MAERSTITQRTQLGIETTPGTAVTATRSLLGLGITPAVQNDVDTFRPTGYKYSTITAVNKEWVSARITGQPNFNELPYIFSSLWTTVTPTSPTDGATPHPLVKDWVFTPGFNTEDTPKTYTVEYGSLTRGERFAYGLITGCDMSFARTGISLTGDMLGQQMTDPFTLTTGGITAPGALVPLLPAYTSVLVDTTPFGTTDPVTYTSPQRQTRMVSVNPKQSSKYDAAWFLNAAVTGFAAHIETQSTNEMEFVLEADAAGMGFLTSNFRTGSTGYFRTEVSSPTFIDAVASTNFPAGMPYRFWWDVALKIKDVAEFSDEDGIYAIGYTGEVVYDSTWNKAQEVRIRTALSSL